MHDTVSNHCFEKVVLMSAEIILPAQVMLNIHNKELAKYKDLKERELKNCSIAPTRISSMIPRRSSMNEESKLVLVFSILL